MTAAAFKATIADWKLIRTRKCVQIVFEVPLEAADEAYQVIGGMPDPAVSSWFAIAKLQQPEGGTDGRRWLTENSPRQETKTGGARKWNELPYSQQAALACNDPIFRAFLREGLRLPADDAEQAAKSVRFSCGVDSRSQIDNDGRAAAFWLKLYDRYQAWKLTDRVAS